MKAPAKNPPVRPRLEQPLPEEITRDLLCTIRRQFVPDVDEKTWFKEHNQFIKRNVVLWPARFIVIKGFTLPVARYKTIMQGILTEIKHHGQTGAVRYWPGYLMKCVQEHWRHNWETYYQEAKSATDRADKTLIALRQITTDRAPDPIAAMAAAQRILTAPKRRPKPAPEKQEMFNL